jgi:hypothetical protein
MATETFTQWLIDRGYEDFVQDEGAGDLEIRDGTVDDRPGLLQSLFSSQYAAWLNHLVNEYGLGSDVDGDGVISVHKHQNNPDMRPTIEGMAADELAGMFGDSDDFVWLSAVNSHAPHTVPHERYYWDSFTVEGDPGGNGNGAGAGNEAAAVPTRVHLVDTNVAFDLEGAAGNAVRLIGAAFGRGAVTPELVGVAIGLFAHGLSAEDVGGLALGTLRFQEQAGSTSNEDFVDTVHENIVGGPPTQAIREYFLGLLEGSGGTMTQAELLVLAANSEANAHNIDLVGLQQTGVEFA